MQDKKTTQSRRKGTSEPNPTTENNQHTENITVGGSYIKGSVRIENGDFVGRDKIIPSGLTAEETATLVAAFDKIAQQVQKLPEGPDKSIAKSAVNGLKEVAEKGEKAEENKVKKWFEFLAQTAPDAFEVAIETFLNPIKGISLIFQKLAQKAREDKEKPQAG